MQIVKLNLIPGGVLPVCFASQHDTGRVIRFMLFEGENIFTLSGAESIELRLKKPDGSELVESVTNTGADYVDVVTTADTCDTAGASVGEIVITDGGGVLGSGNFGLFVESDAFEGSSIVTQTATGRIATFSTNMVEAFKSLKTDINPVQDLHGYSKPWSGGGGKNKLNCTATTETRNGVTLTVVKNSVNQVTQINVTGTATAGVSFTLGTATIEAGTYVLNGYTGGSSVGTKYINYSGIANAYGSNVTSTISETKTTTASLQIANGAETGFTIYPMIRLSNTSADYEPYSNICPISGFSALNVTLADGDMQTVESKTVNFGQTVYGGVADVTNGKVNVTHDNIASYNGESINEPWLSSMDTYVPNTTPTTGAQVVYPLATPIEITTTPENLTAISGENNVYGDTNGDTTVEYYIEV